MSKITTNGKTIAELKRETRMFYSLAAIVFALVIAILFFAPVPQGDSCNDVSIIWLIKGAATDLPTTLRKSWICVSDYKKNNSAYTLGVFCSLYISLQSFAIPGPIVLSVLSGALYGFFAGHLVVAMCATFGASVCFCLSQFFGQGVLHYYGLDDKVKAFEKEANDHKNYLFMFMLLSRILPFPNIVINMASPLIGIPLITFSVGTFFGLMPLNTVHILTGMALDTLANNPSEFQKTLKQNKRIAYVIFGIGSLICLGLYLKRRNLSKKNQ